jgi:TRAP-type C4-dicarboxylate transport system permease large subunit
MFPTSYRATCFALVYSSGKIGSIVVQSIPLVLYSSSERPRIFFLFCMAGCLIVAAVFASAWLPWYRRSWIGWGYWDRLGLENLYEHANDPEMKAPGFRRTFLKWFRYKDPRNL